MSTIKTTAAKETHARTYAEIVYIHLLYAHWLIAYGCDITTKNRNQTIWWNVFYRILRGLSSFFSFTFHIWIAPGPIKLSQDIKENFGHQIYKVAQCSGSIILPNKVCHHFFTSSDTIKMQKSNQEKTYSTFAKCDRKSALNAGQRSYWAQCISIHVHCTFYNVCIHLCALLRTHLKCIRFLYTFITDTAYRWRFPFIPLKTN